jgi:hypothetical protein
MPDCPLLGQSGQRNFLGFRLTPHGSPTFVLKHRAEWKGSRPLARIAYTDLEDRIKRAIAEQMQRVTATAASASEEEQASSKTNWPY